MKTLSKLTALALSAALTLSLAACSGGGGTASKPSAPQSAAPGAGEPLKVGIMQMMDHVALNGAREGFIAALEENGLKNGESVLIDYKNGNGDQNNLSTIADQFVADGKDLVLAIATPAAQAIASKTETIPILATAVTDFVSAGLVESNEVPGDNISGTSDLNPVSKQIDLMFKLYPDIKTVGFLYNSSEDNSRIQVELAKEVLDAKNIAYTEKTVSNQNEVQQATQSIVEECDAIYLPTDNVFASTMPVVQEITVQKGIPTICGENGMVQNGGLASMGPTYYDLGYQAGLMAVDILTKGADISTMAVKIASNFEYMINSDTAEGLGLTVPEDLRQYVVTPEA